MIVRDAFLMMALLVGVTALAQEAVTDAPADPRGALAQATALAESGDLVEARAILESVVASAGPNDPALVQRASYNLGAIQLRQAMTPVAPDGDQGKDEAGIDATRAMALLRDAERSFHASAALDRADVDSARNVEYVRRLRKQIQDKLDQQEQQQEQQKGDDQSKKQQQSDAAQESADELSQLAQQERDAAEDNETDSQSQQEAQRQQQGMSDRAEEALEKLRQQASESQSESAQDQLNEGSENLSQARQKQEESMESLKRGEQQRAAQQQREAAELLDKAAQNAQQAADQLQQEADEQSQQGEEGKDGEGEPEQGDDGKGDQGDPLADRLLDRERQMRQQRDQSRPVRVVPVEKDW